MPPPPGFLSSLGGALPGSLVVSGSFFAFFSYSSGDSPCSFFSWFLPTVASFFLPDSAFLSPFDDSDPPPAETWTIRAAAKSPCSRFRARLAYLRASKTPA